MKKVVILTLIVVIIVVVAAIILWPKDGGGTTVTTPSGDKGPVSSKYAIIETSQEATTGKANIHGNVPYFLEDESSDDNARSLKNLEFAKDINNQIYDIVSTYTDEILLFKDGVSYDDEKNDIINNKQYRYDVEYDRYNNGNIISLVLNMYYNTSGLRSNAWKEPFNIDVIENKLVKLSDLFSESGFKKAITKEINKQAKEKYIKLMDGDGINTLPANQKFYIKDGKLVIYFESSAVSKDELEFTMPFEFDEANSKFIIN